MAVQLICCSHSPLMSTDVEETEKDLHARFFKELESASAELHAFRPELVVVFGPDHFNGFFYELMPAFCIGTSAESSRDWHLENGPLRVPRECARGFPDPLLEGCERQNSRILKHGIIDQHDRARVDETVWRGRESHRHRQPGQHLHGGHVRSDRYRLVVAPPLGVEALEQGKIRIVARGSDVPSLQDQTVRVIVANADSLAHRRDGFRRFMLAYAETMDWMYADDAALRMYAASARIPLAVAKKARDEFYPKNNLRPDRLSGVDQAMADAVAMKFLSAPLTKRQLAEFFQYQLPATP